MIDKRRIIDFDYDKDERLSCLSDTEIIVEFSTTLSDLYPHLIKLLCHCYDPYDEVVMNLFYNLIYSTLSSKYGVKINYKETHTYGFTLHRYHLINHIQVSPKSFPLKCIINNVVSYLQKEDLSNKELIFIQFGDTKNFLTSGEDQINIETVNFDYSELCIVDNKSGLRFRGQPSLWVKNELVDYELVLETYDDEEHKYYLDKYAD
ncbi:MAG: hypothetical protein IPH84_16710 [Bacteroidales bacterium]|nr:hypothetical protein [Bacteroidales bacterium]